MADRQRRLRDVSSPDYGGVLDVLSDTPASSLIELLRAAAGPLEASDICLYLVDFHGTLLKPALLPEGDDAAHPEEVAGSMAGRAFRTGRPVVAEREAGVRAWVPLVERGERTGVLALTVAAMDEDLLAECVRLGRFAGLLVRAFTRTTDLFHLRRQRQPMTLAAGMQWDLLPPLTVRTARALACGRLEPAYQIAGDSFDYAMNDEHLHAGLFDGMGHGVHSTLMTTLAVGAYRHARRAAKAPPLVHAEVDEAVASQYAGEAFVTAVFARLHLELGSLEWSTAGHPGPLLLRGHSVIGQLKCLPSLPLGLGGTCSEVATEQLEPGDSVLFFTDGVVEGRAASGEEFGIERLAEGWEHHAASDLEADEILRGLVADVLAHSSHKLRDDASLMLLRWDGQDGAPSRQAAGGR